MIYVETTLISVRKRFSMSNQRIYSMSFAKIYPLYISKANKKGRTKAEVDKVIKWLTGYSQKQINSEIEKETDLENFFRKAPRLNPLRDQIKGSVCGIKIENIKEPLMREIRYLDKLIDELARGKEMVKILRS